MRAAGLVVVVLLGMPALYLCVALILGLVPVNRDFRPDPEGIDVFLVTNGAHADLVLPLRTPDVDWTRRLPLGALEPVEGEAEALAFGWGDRAFYIGTPTWDDFRLSTALVALTGLDPSVLHVETTAIPPPGERTRRIPLSALQYRKLAAFIENSFGRRPDGAVTPIPGARYGFHDAFFEAQGRYSLVSTCNEWARRALFAAGVRVPLWSPFDKALLYQLPADETPS